MKEFGHLIIGIALAVMSLSIFGITHTNENVKSLDFARFYTLKWIRDEPDSALLHLGIPDRCLSVTSLSGDAECLAARTATRDNILLHMRCDKYGSQACAYLTRVLQALVRTSTTERIGNATSPFKQVGLNLKAKAPAAFGEGTYLQMLSDAVELAPKVFHGAYQAEQSDATLVLRSALYNLIVMAILGNLVVHILDSFPTVPRYMRFWIRVLSFVMVFLTAFVFLCIHTGNILVLGLILISSLVSLVHFELFLNETIVRPWVHPFMFSTVYQSLVVLALVENGVLDYHVIVVNMLLSMCIAELFMALTWYQVGYVEKLRLEGTAKLLYKAYQTKEVHQALLAGVLTLYGVAIQLVVAPYDYSYRSVFMLAAPLVLVGVSEHCTKWIDGMHLGDEGEEDSEKRRYRMVNGLPDPTAITGAKLASSALMLLFAAVVLMIYFWEHVETFRAYLNAMPPASAAAIDESRRFLLGPGVVAPAA